MRLYAASDLHLDRHDNYREFLKINSPGNDCLILAGDICETEEQLKRILDHLRPLYSNILWTAGNHELWVRPGIAEGYSSQDRYYEHVEVCRSFDVHTPEDPFLRLRTKHQKPLTLAPLFNLYDYSFRPDHVSRERAIDWAKSAGILCMDEVLFRLGNFPTIDDWCLQRTDYSKSRLEQVPSDDDLVLINHFPLLEKSFMLKKIPEFSLWCGTKLTENWHKAYRVRAVVNGHLHMPGKKTLDDVPFFDVSVGYPGQWDKRRTMDRSFTELFPGEHFEIYRSYP